MLAQTLQTTDVTTREQLSDTREQLIMEHLPQVRLIARRIHSRMPGAVNFEDLVSSGTVGLIAAIDRYDQEQGVKLRTYAEFKIRGAILDSLRANDLAPRSQRRRGREIQKAKAAIEQRTGAVPGPEEIAQELGISAAECREWMSQSQALAFTSLDRTTTDEEGNAQQRQIADGENCLPSHNLEATELRSLLAACINHMPKQEKIVLSLIFNENLSLREIAKVMDLHESRISQIKSQALSRMRKLLETRWPKKGSQRAGWSTASRVQ